MAHGAHVHVDEVGIAVIADPAALQLQSGIAHSIGTDSRQPNIDGFRQHVETVESDTGMGTPVA